MCLHVNTVAFFTLFQPIWNHIRAKSCDHQTNLTIFPVVNWATYLCSPLLLFILWSRLLVPWKLLGQHIGPQAGGVSSLIMTRNKFCTSDNTMLKGTAMQGAFERDMYKRNHGINSPNQCLIDHKSHTHSSHIGPNTDASLVVIGPKWKDSSS
jgi:hypothetical protein